MKATLLKKIIQTFIGFGTVFFFSGFSFSQDISSLVNAQKEYNLLAPKINKSGLYESERYIFGVVVKPYNVRNRQLDGLEAEAQVGAMFLESCVKKHDKQLSLEDKKLLSAVQGNMSISGHVLFSGKKDNQFQYVVAAKKTDFQAVCQKSLISRHINSVKADALKFPQNYSPLTEKLEIPELSLLASLKFDKSLPPNVGKPSANPFISSSTPPIQQPPAFYCVSAEQIENSLKNKKVKKLETSYKTPILSRVSECQGFVKFNSSQSREEPPQLDVVRKLFKQGKDLPTAIYLLESSIEMAPENSEIWELLEAAYRSAGLTDKSRLANRVWYLTSNKEEEALRKLLSTEDMKTGGEYLLRPN